MQATGIGIIPDTTNVRSYLKVVDSNNAPVTSLTSASAGLELAYIRDGAAVVTDSGSANNLASATAAHNDWGMIHVSNGLYRIDFPDAAFATGVDVVTLQIFATSSYGVDLIVPLNITTFDQTAADKFAAILEGTYLGTVDDTSFTPSTSQFETTDVAVALVDELKDQVLRWRTGAANAGVDCIVTAMSTPAGSRILWTVKRLDGGVLPSAPADGDTFVKN